MYDVIVIGAGISGLTCSKYLSEKGLNVLVLEKEDRIGAQIGDNLQGFFDRELKKIEFEIPRDNPINKFKIWLPCGDILEFNFDRPFMYLVIRGGNERSFDNYLADKAANSGAKILTKARVVDISFTSKGSQVKIVDGRTFDARYIVAADGANLFVRRLLGLEIFETKGVGMGVTMTNVDIEKSTFHGVFGLSIAPAGYGYVNAYPQEGLATVAVSYGPKYADQSPAVYFERLLQRIAPITRNAKEVSKFSGRVVCGEGDQTLVYENVLFVGESAGFQDRMFGFGMPFAITSARIASEIIHESHAKNDYAVLDEYERICKRTLIKSVNKVSTMRNIMKRMQDEDMDAILRSFEGEEIVLKRIFQTGDWKLAKWNILRAISRRPSLLRFSKDFLESLLT